MTGLFDERRKLMEQVLKSKRNLEEFEKYVIEEILKRNELDLISVKWEKLQRRYR